MADALGDDLLGVVARLHRWATRAATVLVPAAQLRLLALLEEIGDARTGDLARADHCSQPTMSAQVARLESQGWVDRVPDAADARASLLRLNGSGRDVLTAARAARSRAVSPLLESLTARDRATLARAVVILDAALAAAPEPAPGDTPADSRTDPGPAGCPAGAEPVG